MKRYIDGMAQQLPTLQPNVEKSVATIGFLIRLGAERGRAPTQYDIVKSIFLADTAHLNEFGRPITYDNYYAMNHGPVPSLAYDMLKGNLPIGLSPSDLPWRRSVVHEQGAFEFYPVGTDSFDEDLSPSDMDELTWAFDTVSKLGFQGVRKLTHEHPAYVAAWPAGASGGSHKMDLSLLLNKPDAELIENMVEYAPYV